MRRFYKVAGTSPPRMTVAIGHAISGPGSPLPTKLLSGCAHVELVLILMGDSEPMLFVKWRAELIFTTANVIIFDSLAARSRS